MLDINEKLGQTSGYPLNLFIPSPFAALMMVIKRIPLLSLLQFVFIVMMGVITLASCKSETPTQQESVKEKKSFTDDLGRVMNFDTTPQRVVSLAPSITEILFFIGAQNQIVGRTQACDYPEEAKSLTVVSTYPLDIESIVKLNPDVVLSVDGIINLEQVKKIESLGIKVFFQKYETIDDINRSIQTIGTILGREKRAAHLVDSLNTELEKQKYSSTQPLQALMLTWTKPIYVFGKNTPFTDKIKFAGAENSMKEVLNSPYPELSREYILKMNPDIVLGYSFEKLDSTFFKMYPELKVIKAYQKKQIFDVDDNLMSRPSPRYVESIQELKGIISKCN